MRQRQPQQLDDSASLSGSVFEVPCRSINAWLSLADIGNVMLNNICKQGKPLDTGQKKVTT